MGINSCSCVSPSGRDTQGDRAGSVDGQSVELPGGGGDAGLEDPVGRGDRFHDSETNDREEDVMDAEGQDDPLSQSPLTGIGLDAEDPCDEVPGLSPNVGEEPRLVLQDQLTDSLICSLVQSLCHSN